MRLEDSANAFTEEFARQLDKAIIDLRAKVAEYLQQNPEANLSIASTYIYQLDYTQDLFGFFFTLAQSDDHGKLAELLNMPAALRNEYKSFLSCLYFLERNEAG